MADTTSVQAQTSAPVATTSSAPITAAPTATATTPAPAPEKIKVILKRPYGLCGQGAELEFTPEQAAILKAHGII